MFGRRRWRREGLEVLLHVVRHAVTAVAVVARPTLGLVWCDGAILSLPRVAEITGTAAARLGAEGVRIVVEGNHLVRRGVRVVVAGVASGVALWVAGRVRGAAASEVRPLGVPAISTPPSTPGGRVVLWIQAVGLGRRMRPVALARV